VRLELKNFCLILTCIGKKHDKIKCVLNIFFVKIPKNAEYVLCSKVFRVCERGVAGKKLENRLYFLEELRFHIFKNIFEYIKIVFIMTILQKFWGRGYLIQLLSLYLLICYC
jgi:hypothetical protein